MRRHLAFRLIAAVLALWFGLNSAVPELLFACPVHSGIAGHRGGVHVRHSSGAHAMATGEHRKGTPSTHSCSCAGDCCAASLQSLELPRFLAVTSPDIRVERSVVRQEGVFREPASGAHFIPFSNGPPTTA
jgi:hypothetical protein